MHSALPAPCVKANGATGTVTVNYPDPLSITVEMNAKAYAGVPADWWVLACAGSSWYYLDSAIGWTQVGAWRPVHQGALGNLQVTKVLNISGLAMGSYTFYFAVDSPMDGILNVDGPIWVDSVNVNVTEANSRFLVFPVQGYTPYNHALISCIFDHFTGNVLTHHMLDANGKYTADKVIEAFTGEHAEQQYGDDPDKGYENQQHTEFTLGGIYHYTGTKYGKYLYYDGHPGVDIAVGSGTPIIASAPGTVIEAGWDNADPNKGLGQYVKIQHPNGYYTIYGHLSRIDVQLHAGVDEGTPIGLSGDTGAANGAHLHFQVRYGNSTGRYSVDPYGYMGSDILWKTQP
jgi:murein DD-endopeptidase MepM/ murein hydrolase activator NlpD